MTPEATLVELLERVGTRHGAAVVVSDHELSEWPIAVVAAMKSQGLLTKARPAASAACPGCERECVMTVHVLTDKARGVEAFIVCDKRSDINRVPVPISHLEQWQASGDSIADLLAGLLGLHRSGASGTDAARWEVGMLKGAKHSSHLVLIADGTLTLSMAGHSIALAEVLVLEGKVFKVDRRTLNHLVDHPVAGAGDVESAAQRRGKVKTGAPATPVEDACAAFRRMEELRPSEIAIAIVGDTSESGLSGNNMLEISARGIKRRMSLAEFGLVDRRGGSLSQQAAVLVGLTHGEKFSRSEVKNSAIMKRLRSEFRSRLGVKADPFTPHHRETGWRPLFSIVDIRGRSDARAKHEAERRTVSLNQLQDQGRQFAANDGEHTGDEADAAGNWLKENDPKHLA
jgi:hypothetical protein